MQEEKEPDYFTVEPRTDCPHVNDADLDKFAEFLHLSLKGYDRKAQDHVFARMACADCQSTKENWICLKCASIGCSRYVASHMAAHNASTHHPVAFSFSDGSFWCYDCDSYVTNVELGKLRRTFGVIKHKMHVGKGDLVEAGRVTPILQELAKLNDAQDAFTRTQLVEGLKNKTFKKVVGITGAGISVAAGIPDFRSPGGLYHKLAEQYGLKHPEEIMTIEFFKKSPEPLYAIMKEFLASSVLGAYQDQAYEVPQLLRRPREKGPVAEVLHAEHRRSGDRSRSLFFFHDPGARPRAVMLLQHVPQ